MPIAATTDPQLLDAAKDWSSDAAWGEFYERYGPGIRAAAIRSGLSSEDADEVAQETMLRVARHLPDFRYNREVCRFRTWLNQIVQQRILDCLRRRQRFANAERALTHAALIHPRLFASKYPEPAAEELALIEAALSRVRAEVPPTQWQVFESVVLHELSAAETARTHQVSVANVYVIRHRLLARLKSELAAWQEGPF